MSEGLSIKVRNELYKRKMTHTELANLLGISGAYLSDILNGSRRGKKAQEHVKRICAILEIEVYQI